MDIIQIQANAHKLFRALVSDEVQIVSSLILVKSNHKIPMVQTLKSVEQEDDLRKYEGQYEYSNGSILSVSVEGDKLFIQKDTNYRKQIFRHSDKRFIYEFYDVEIEFNSLKDGEVDALTVIAGGQKTKSPKISDRPRNNLNLGARNIDSGAKTFIEKSWNAILKKSYAEAIEFCLAGIELSPDDLSLKLNLAHAYLFSGDQVKALKIYRENMNQKQFGSIPFSRLIQQDFIFFASRKYSKEILYKVYSELNLVPADAFKKIN